MGQYLRLWFCLAMCGVAVAGCAAPPPADLPVRGLAAETADVDADGAPVAPEAETPPARKGLFGLLSRAPAAPEDAAPSTQAPESAPHSAAAPNPEAAPRRGLFGALFGPADGAPEPDSPEGAGVKGAVLPFGQVATVCGLSTRELGPAVDQYSKDGRARWKLHDPTPASTGPRTQYITGFKDRCARQVTGAMALFGNANVHETTRYAASNTRPYTATDDAYEKVKSRLCGVRPQVACPADRQDRLSKSVSFVTVYSQFGATSEWYELLLVDGELEAAAISGL